MTLDQVVNSLPNGLHDAKLETINIDFAKREVRLELDIWIGDEIDSEAYRRAEIVYRGCSSGFLSRLIPRTLSTRRGRSELTWDR